MIKKIGGALLILLIILMGWHHKLVYYGLVQGKGQLSIIWNAKPVQSFLDDPSTPDSVRQKLLFIEEVRQFAIHELNLNDTDNYTTMYDQKGKPILWVVTGCEPYAFEPKKWDFPVVGEVPYKGFFIQDMADNEMVELERQGYDVGVRTVGGWSTLGWFTDPILSNMLGRSYGDLANLIIHELVHSTIFVKDSVDFNENLASFIGDRGTEIFLEKYYRDSHAVAYANELQDELKYTEHVLRGADKLDSLYSYFEDKDTTGIAVSKRDMIDEIIQQMDTLSLSRFTFLERLKKRNINNTYFMSFLRYRSKQVPLETLYEEDFNNNLTAFIKHLKGKYPFL